MATSPKLVSYFDQEMMISLQIPEGWQIGHTDQFLRIYLAPAEDNYQVNLGMNVNQSNNAPAEAMDQLLQQTDQQRQQQDPTYKQTSYEKLEIDGNQARLRHYSWSDAGSGLNFSQVQALILKGPLLLVIDGSSLKQHEKSYIPLLDSVIKSIRFVQPQQP